MSAGWVPQLACSCGVYGGILRLACRCCKWCTKVGLGDISVSKGDASARKMEVV